MDGTDATCRAPSAGGTTDVETAGLAAFVPNRCPGRHGCPDHDRSGAKLHGQGAEDARTAVLPGQADQSPHQRHSARRISIVPSDKNLVPELAAAAVDSLPGGAILGVLVDRAARAVQSEWRRNQSTAIRVATARAGLSREDLAELLEREPRLSPLLIRVLFAAGTNGHDKTLKLLGGFLGEALTDTTRIDDVSLILSVIEDLSEHHIKVLEIVESPLNSHDVATEASATRWTTGLVVRVAGMRRELALVATQGLLNAGLVSNDGIDGGGATFGDLETGGTILQITELGQTILQVLRAVSDE